MAKRDWFRHPLDFSKTPISAVVEKEFGVAGYGHLMKFLEEFISHIKPPHEKLIAQMSITRWTSTLGFKSKSFTRFLNLLQKESYLTWSQNSNIVTIEMPKLSEILDLTFGKKRDGKSNPDREEDKIFYHTDIDTEEDIKTQKTNADKETLLSSNKSLIDRIDSCLATYKDELPKRIGDIIRNHVGRYGEKELDFEAVKKRIAAKFEHSEKAKAYGQDIIKAIPAAIKEGQRHYGNVEYEKRSLERAALRRELRKSSPHVKDERLSRIAHAIINIDEDATRPSLEQATELVVALRKHYVGNEEFYEQDCRNYDSYQRALLEEAKPVSQLKKRTPKVLRKIDDDDDQ